MKQETIKQQGIKLPRNVGLAAPKYCIDFEIQGLYRAQGACKSFWTLRAKIELLVFAKNGDYVE